MPVLIVEDQVFIAGMFKIFLKGHRILVAHDGATALKLFEDEYPNVVVTDVELPDMSGFDIRQQVRARSNVPVIIITAYEAYAARAVQEGASLALVKPVSKGALVSAVSSLKLVPIQGASS
jgi:DNA-binding response OmpR family regulator